MKKKKREERPLTEEDQAELVDGLKAMFAEIGYDVESEDDGTLNFKLKNDTTKKNGKTKKTN